MGGWVCGVNGEEQWGSEQSLQPPALSFALTELLVVFAAGSSNVGGGHQQFVWEIAPCFPMPEGAEQMFPPYDLSHFT